MVPDMARGGLPHGDASLRLHRPGGGDEGAGINPLARILNARVSRFTGRNLLAMIIYAGDSGVRSAINLNKLNEALLFSPETYEVAIGYEDVTI